MKVKSLISALKLFPKNAEIVVSTGENFEPLMDRLTLYKEDNELALETGFGEKTPGVLMLRSLNGKKKNMVDNHNNGC